MGACSSSNPAHTTTLKPVTAAMREQGLKDGVDAYQFPRMKIFNKMAPAHLVTLFSLYTKALGEGAFNYFTPQECEVIFAAISAVNNCEFCLSFHAMQMAQHGVSAADVQAISNGGVPSDPKLAALVVAAKYAAAHKGVFLTREKKHLKALGFSGEKLAELNFISGLMGAFNQNFVHLLSEGAELEDMIKPFSPFAGTVYN